MKEESVLTKIRIVCGNMSPTAKVRYNQNIKNTMIQKCCCKGRTNVPFLDEERKEEETGPRGYIAQGNFAQRTKKKELYFG